MRIYGALASPGTLGETGAGHFDAYMRRSALREKPEQAIWMRMYGVCGPAGFTREAQERPRGPLLHACLTQF